MSADSLRYSELAIRQCLELCEPGARRDLEALLRSHQRSEAEAVIRRAAELRALDAIDRFLTAYDPPMAEFRREGPDGRVQTWKPKTPRQRAICASAAARGESFVDLPSLRRPDPAPALPQRRQERGRARTGHTVAIGAAALLALACAAFVAG